VIPLRTAGIAKKASNTERPWTATNLLDVYVRSEFFIPSGSHKKARI